MKSALWIARVQLALAFGLAGAMKLILPGPLRIRQGLTLLAAAGLAIVMAGATATTLAIGGRASALMPLALGVLAVFVVFGRTRFGQSTDETSRRPVLKPAG